MNDVEKVVFCWHAQGKWVLRINGRASVVKLRYFSLQKKMICGENAPAVSLEI